MMMFIRSLIFNGTRILFRSKRANGGQYQIHYYTSRFQLMKQSFMDDDLAILAKELDSIPKYFIMLFSSIFNFFKLNSELNHWIRWMRIILNF